MRGGRPLKRYDLTKLTEAEGIDTGLVKLFFFDNRDYFSALSEFLKNFGHPLAHFTPAFVIHSPEDRALFMKECLFVRTTLMKLGLSLAIREVDVMENAIYAGAVKEFSDGQVKFGAAVKIYNDIIKNAEVQ
jgi:hypothetical protein